VTFVIKIRGSTDRPIAAEYYCPIHGRFELTVERDANGDAPSSATCPARVEPRSFALFGLNGEARSQLFVCRSDSPYVISAPRVGVRRVEAVKGGWEKPARKTFLDTRNLGEGQDIEEWRDERAAIRDQQRRDSLKELMNG
jgi:hypothetical protein